MTSATQSVLGAAITVAVLSIAPRAIGAQQPIEPQTIVRDWKAVNRHATVVDSGGRKFVRLDEGPSMGLVWTPFDFTDGEIVSQPAYPWERLRSQQSGQYEKPVLPEPDPNAWVHLRVVVRGNDVSAFVNASASPALHVQRLSGRNRGGLGLWVGDPSPGDFANLIVRPVK